MLNTDKIQITHEMLLAVGELDAFKGAWNGLRGIGLKPLTALRRAAGMESVAASVRMAGGRLTDGRIERLMEETVEIEYPSGEEFDPLGYAHALTKILHGWKQMQASEAQILRLHFWLMGFGRRAGKEAGEYKSWARPLAAADEEGRKAGIRLQTADARKTPERMRELAAWLEREERAGKMHKLLLTGMFVARLLAIHPFLEGNGRLSRLLTTLLLLRFGYEYVPYSSLEAVLEGYGEEYPRALRRTQMTLGGDAPDWEPWLMFFLDALREQKRRLAEKVKEERKLQANQTELSVAILERVRKEGRVRMAEAMTMTGAKRTTLREHFRKLVRERRLEQHGECKGTWYSAA
ncbi:MAG: Fic family protein [Terracidiphilus sp.]